MNRRFCLAMLVAAGMVLGCGLNGCDKTSAASATDQESAEDERQAADAIAQLKEVNNQLRQMNAFLRSGQMRVVPVINSNSKIP
jgi:hypothetical protein